jgi:hypothetical protein
MAAPPKGSPPVHEEEDSAQRTTWVRIKNPDDLAALGRAPQGQAAPSPAAPARNVRPSAPPPPEDPKNPFAGATRDDRSTQLRLQSEGTRGWLITLVAFFFGLLLALAMAMVVGR